MPTIQFITKITEEGVIQTFEKVAKSIEQTSEASDHLSEKSAEHSGKMQIDWKEVGTVFAVTGAAIAGAGVAVVGSLFEMAEATSKVGTEMDLLSQRTGLTTEMLSELSLSAQLNGVSIDNVTTGLRLLATHMENATVKGGAADDTFKRLGISITDTNGQMRPTSDVLLDVADKFSHMENGATKSALAVSLFGRGGLALIPILNQGREGLAANAEEAAKLGIVYSGEAAKAAHEFEDANVKLHASFAGLTRAIGEEAYPILQRWIGSLTEVVVHVKDWVNANPALADSLLRIAGAMAVGGVLLLGVGSLIVTMPTLVGWIGTFATTTTIATATTGLWGEALVTTSTEAVAATGVIGGLTAALETAVAIITGPVGIAIAIGAAVTALVYFIDKTEIGHRVISDIVGAFKDAAAAVGKFVEILGRIAWSEIVDYIKSTANAWGNYITGVENATKATATFLGIHTDGAFATIGAMIEAQFTNPYHAVKSALTDATAAMKAFADRAGIGTPTPDTGFDGISTQVLDLTKHLAENSEAWKLNGEASALGAEEQKKLREDASKANDEFFKGEVDYFKHQRAMGLISNQDLLGDLNDFENQRFEKENHADGNLQELTQKHLNILHQNQIEFDVAASKMAEEQRKRDQDDINQVGAIHLTAQNEQINNDIAFFNKMSSLGGGFSVQARNDLYALEAERWSILTGSHTATESETIDHLNRLQGIEDKYAIDSVGEDAALNAARQLYREENARQQTASYQQQDERAVASGKALIKNLHETALEQNKIGLEVQHEWESAMNQMDKAMASAFADMIVHGKFSMDALVKIAESAGKSMLTAFLDGLIRPLTDELAKLGTKLTDTILGITQTQDAAGKSTGGLLNGGGLFGLLHIGGGSNAGDATKALGDGVQGPVLPGGGSGGSGSSGGGSGMGGALEVAGISAAVGIGAALITSWYKNLAHFKANELVKNFQEPFDRKFQEEVGIISDAWYSGTLSKGDAQSADDQLHQLWGNTKGAVSDWAAGDSKKETVRNQFLATEAQYTKPTLDWVDAITMELGGHKSVQSFAVGTPYVPYDMLAMIHQGERVVPAAQNRPWMGSGMGGAGNMSISLTFAGDFNFNGLQTNDPEVLGRKVMDVVFKQAQNDGRFRAMLQTGGSRPPV